MAIPLMVIMLKALLHHQFFFWLLLIPLYDHIYIHRSIAPCTWRGGHLARARSLPKWEEEIEKYLCAFLRTNEYISSIFRLPILPPIYLFVRRFFFVGGVLVLWFLVFLDFAFSKYTTYLVSVSAVFRPDIELSAHNTHKRSYTIQK